MLKLLKKFRRDKKGVAAVEMALIFPVFLAFFFSMAEFANYNMQERRAKLSVELAAEFMSRDPDGQMSRWERLTLLDIWMVVNSTSYLADTPRSGGWANGYSRGLASVDFVKKNPSCTGLDCEYEPDVQWSFMFRDIIQNPVQTKCDLTVVGDRTKLNGSNIPKGVVGRSPVVIADFVYKYQPLASTRLFPSKEIHVNAIRQVRGTNPLENLSQDWLTRC